MMKLTVSRNLRDFGVLTIRDPGGIRVHQRSGRNQCIDIAQSRMVTCTTDIQIMLTGKRP